MTFDGSWCFFADPRAVYFAGKFRRTYVGWLTSGGDVRVGCFDHDHGQKLDSVLLKASLQKDDHANPSLWMDDSGYLTVFYSAHNGKTMYYRTALSPESIEEFGEEQTLPINSEGHKGYTYPNPVYLRSEQRLFLFWRGGNFKPVFSVTEDLASGQWSNARSLIEDRGSRPYIKFASDHDSVIHFACTDGHPNEEAHNGIHYACYRNNALYRADGSKIKDMAELPLTIADMDTVVDPESGKHCWIWDIVADQNGNPAMVYAVFVTPSDHRYYYSCWTDGQWVTNEITAAGSWFPQTPEGVAEREVYYSGGLVLDPRNPKVVYLSRMVEGTFEIERWTTPDRGASWHSEAITSSSQQLNVRPFVSRGPLSSPTALFWMNGEYIHYTDYHTALLMQVVQSSDVPSPVAELD